MSNTNMGLLTKIMNIKWFKSETNTSGIKDWTKGAKGIKDYREGSAPASDDLDYMRGYREGAKRALEAEEKAQKKVLKAAEKIMEEAAKMLIGAENNTANDDATGRLPGGAE